jgi:hypothetical protein
MRFTVSHSAPPTNPNTDLSEGRSQRREAPPPLHCAAIELHCTTLLPWPTLPVRRPTPPNVMAAAGSSSKNSDGLCTSHLSLPLWDLVVFVLGCDYDELYPTKYTAMWSYFPNTHHSTWYVRLWLLLVNLRACDLLYDPFGKYGYANTYTWDDESFPKWKIMSYDVPFWNLI